MSDIDLKQLNTLLDELAADLTDSEDDRKILALITLIMTEVSGASDRACAITTAAIVEDILRSTICSRFIEISKTSEGRLFDNEGPLSSFSAKINIGYALGLYGQITRSDLHLIRRVRNRFAHSIVIVGFQGNEIAQLCNEIRLPDQLRDPELPRLESPQVRYVSAAFLLAGFLGELGMQKARIAPIENDNYSLP